MLLARCKRRKKKHFDNVVFFLRIDKMDSCFQLFIEFFFPILSWVKIKKGVKLFKSLIYRCPSVCMIYINFYIDNLPHGSSELNIFWIEVN